MVNMTHAECCACHLEVKYCKCSMSRLRLIIFYLLEYLVILAVGGFVYYGIEILWRGYSHWSMFFVGGFCLILVGLLNEFFFTHEMGIIQQMIIGGFLITGVEFVSGLIINVWLGLGVWDYSDMPLNIMGQICIPFTFAWMLLALVAIVLDDLIKHFLFGMKFPTYVLWHT